MIIQGGILGVIAGSVVGLFAANLTNSTQSIGSLSVPALAFLAGYNVPGLFALFDDISNRIFRSSAATASEYPRIIPGPRH
jgi:hypothetical protein